MDFTNSLDITKITVGIVIKVKRFAVHFPIACRTTVGEQGFLSPTQNSESAFLAFHI